MAAGVLSSLHGETSYRYRKFKSDAMMAVTVGATIVTLIPLFLVLGYLLSKGVTSLNWAFFTHMPAPVGEQRHGQHEPAQTRHSERRNSRSGPLTGSGWVRLDACGAPSIRTS